jgi:glucose-6-phosphate 1-epimerase
MTTEELNAKYEIPGVLRFAPGNGGLLAAHITAPAAEATVYIQGAHLTHWKPAGQAPAIFVSPKSEYAAGKPIRGGIPVIFPWFSERHDGKTGPMHGFARISDWQLAFAAMSGDDLHLMWTLEPNDLSRSLGFDHFKVGYRISIGRKLAIELTVANDSGNGGHTTREEIERNGAPLVFEEACHTYYAVADARQVTIDGLGNTDYVDKVDNFKRKHQGDTVLHLTGRTDRPYLNTTATCVLHDPAGKRKITVAKTGSNSTVVWNPWDEFCAKMPDMQADSWLHMTCIETANVGDNTITIKPGAAHSMKFEVTLEPLAE